MSSSSPALDLARMLLARRIVRVRRILVRRNDRIVLELEPRGLEARRDPLLQLVLGDRLARAAPLPRLLERRARGCRDDLRCALVRRELLAGPQRVEARDERARRHDLRAGRAHHLEHAARHAIEIRHGVARRILHRDLLAVHEREERLLEHLPASVAHALPRLRPPVPRPLLDVVRHRRRHALARHVREHAPRHHAVEIQRAGRDRIRPLKIEEEPSVELRVGERALQIGECFGSQHAFHCGRIRTVRLSCQETPKRSLSQANFWLKP